MNKDELNTLFQKADRGDPDAMASAACHALFDDRSVPLPKEQYDRVVRYLKTAIAAGNTDAMITYGALFYNGMGVEQDYNQAIHWYKEAADRGNRIAISYMGYQYYYGRGDLDVNMEMAYRYFSKAAMLGVPNAYYKCGDMFLEGHYVDKDPDTAFLLYWECFCRVFEEKPIDCYPDVCRRLGTCYHKGIGITKDLQTAKHLLAKAIICFQERVNKGDRYTDEVLRQARKEWTEVCRELDSENE